MAVATIAASSQNIVIDTTSDRIWQAKCAFDTGSALYCVAQNASDITVFKSTSRTTPSWTEQDGSNAPWNGSIDYPFTCQFDGTYIYVWGFSSTSATKMWRFNTSTDSWTTDLGSPTTSLTNAFRNIGFGIRSGGTISNAYCYSIDDADYQRVRYTGSSWTSAGYLLSSNSAEASNILAVVQDGSDNTHFFYHNAQTDDLEWVSSEPTLESLTSVVDINTAAASTEDAQSTGVFEVWDDSGTDKVQIAYMESGTGVRTRTVTLDAAATSGNLGTEVTLSGSPTGNGVCTVTARVGTTTYVGYNDSGALKYHTDTGSGYGSATTWKSSMTAWIQLLPVGTNGLLGIYQDGTSVKSDWVLEPSTTVTGAISTGSLSVTGGTITATAGTGATGALSTGSLSVTGQTITGTASTNDTGDVATGSHAVTGQTITGTAGAQDTGNVATGSLSVTGQTITGDAEITGEFATGIHVVSGQTITGTFATGDTGALATGTLNVTGQTITGTAGTQDTGSLVTGVLAIGGQTITGGSGHGGELITASLAITGQTITGTTGSGDTGTVSTGGLAVTGGSITGGSGVGGDLVTGSLAIAGQTITGSVSGNAIGYVESGLLVVTGGTITGQADAHVDVTSGSLVISGQSINGSWSVVGEITSQTLAITGQTITGFAQAGATGEIVTGIYVITPGEIIGNFRGFGALAGMLISRILLVGDLVASIVAANLSGATRVRSVLNGRLETMYGTGIEGDTVRLAIADLAHDTLGEITSGATVDFTVYRADGTVHDSGSMTYDSSVGWNTTFTLPSISTDQETLSCVATATYSGATRTFNARVVVRNQA